VPRSLAAAVSPSLTGAMFAAGAMVAPLVACGVLKIAYDIALFAAFRRVEARSQASHLQGNSQPSAIDARR